MGIEPTTHGFSGRFEGRFNCCGSRGLGVGGSRGAALALRSCPILQEIIDTWALMSPAARVAALAAARVGSVGQVLEVP